jgi:eukaryotic-like serine/threonine-protein kinase
MSESGKQPLVEVVMRALELRGPERAAYLDGLRASEPHVASEAARLVARHEQGTGVLLTPPDEGNLQSEEQTMAPASGKTAARDSDGEGPGGHIGAYRLLQEIGEGGFGTVYMAEQESPVQRRVALKIIKLGMDTRAVIARFEAERQALALMDHANIAKVFDAGATSSGRPYFVMELVKGDPITRYCDTNHLSVPERLALLEQVCSAVQHAHQKGIIHRDLKPSNVLVSTQDGRPFVKVIDFGIAKATAAKLTARTLFTEHKALIGTPEYMSPEQAEGSLDIDTRTDVYSLGVLLYELLTGSTPFTHDQLRAAAYAEIERIIREVEPPKPSTRLSESSDTLPSIAAQRRTEPRKLGVIVRGELDWIVMKALEKDRARRYDSANALAADLRRYLSGEPVVAAPPGRLYRVRKFVHRHRSGVAAAALISLALLLGMASTVAALFAFRSQRDAAVEARSKMSAALADSDAVATFLTDTLAASQPAKLGREVQVRSVLDESAKSIGEKFAGRPVLEARIRQVTGDTYFALGVYPSAEEHQRRAWELRKTHLGPESPDTLHAQASLALTQWKLGRIADAEDLVTSAYAAQKRTLGEDNPSTLWTANALGTIVLNRGRPGDAETIFRAALPLSERISGATDPQTIMLRNNLALALQYQGRASDAEAIHRHNVEVLTKEKGLKWPVTLDAMFYLAWSIQSQGRHAEAEQIHRQVLALRSEVLGPDHPDTLWSLHNLAWTLVDQGKLGEGLDDYRAALTARLRVLGPDHPVTLLNQQLVADTLSLLGRFTEAEDLNKDTLARRTRVLGPDDPDSILSLVMLAGNQASLGRHEESCETLKRVLAKRRAVFAPDDDRIWRTTGQLAEESVIVGRFAEAEPLMLDGYTHIEQAAAAGKAKATAVRDAARQLAEMYEKWELAEPGRGHSDAAATWRRTADAP